MQEIQVWQDIDNRVGSRVKKPVIIVESNLMESDKSPVPVQGHGCPNNGWQGHGQDSGQFQIAIAMLSSHPQDPGGACQSAADNHVFEEIEDILYFFKMDAPAF